MEEMEIKYLASQSLISMFNDMVHVYHFKWKLRCWKFAVNGILHILRKIRGLLRLRNFIFNGLFLWTSHNSHLLFKHVAEKDPLLKIHNFLNKSDVVPKSKSLVLQSIFVVEQIGAPGESGIFACCAFWKPFGCLVVFERLYYW